MMRGKNPLKIAQNCTKKKKEKLHKKNPLKIAINCQKLPNCHNAKNCQKNYYFPKYCQNRGHDFPEGQIWTTVVILTPSSPVCPQGYNRLIVFSRPFYFCVCCSTVLLLHYLSRGATSQLQLYGIPFSVASTLTFLRDFFTCQSTT